MKITYYCFKNRSNLLCQMVSLYYTFHRDRPSDCGNFNLSVQLIPGAFFILFLNIYFSTSFQIFYPLWHKENPYSQLIFIGKYFPTESQDETIYRLRIHVLWVYLRFFFFFEDISIIYMFYSCLSLTLLLLSWLLWLNRFVFTLLPICLAFTACFWSFFEY